jgi:hypothetical protein
VVKQSKICILKKKIYCQFQELVKIQEEAEEAATAAAAAGKSSSTTTAGEK